MSFGIARNVDSSSNGRAAAAQHHGKPLIGHFNGWDEEADYLRHRLGVTVVDPPLARPVSETPTCTVGALSREPWEDTRFAFPTEASL